MIKRIYSYRCPVPRDVSLFGLRRELVTIAERITRHNNVITGVEARFAQNEAGCKEVEISLVIQGRDQWWIKKRAPYAVMPLLAKARLPRHEARLVAVERLEDRRVTRARASDGCHNEIPEDILIPHEELENV